MNNTFKMLLALISALSAGHGQAAFKESHCPKSKNLKRTFISNKVKAPCKTLKQITNTFQEIQKFAGTQKPITLFVKEESFTASVSISGMVVLSERQKGWSEVRNLQKSKMIWAHEYGHVVFNNLMLKSFPQIEPFYVFMKKHDDHSIKSLNPNKDNFDKVRSFWSEDARYVMDLQKGYSELFADIVAVLFTEDTHAVSKAMVAKGMDKKSKNNLKFYNFDESISEKYAGKEIHFIFFSAKKSLAKAFKFPMTNNQKKSFLLKIYKIILSEMKAILSRKPKNINYKKLNQSLINKFHKLKINL